MEKQRNAPRERHPAGQRVVAAFQKRGISVSAWARKNNVSAPLVWRVLEKGGGERGQSHRIAVLLGLKKDAAVGDLDSFDPAAAVAEDAAAN